MNGGKRGMLEGPSAGTARLPSERGLTGKGGKGGAQRSIILSNLGILQPEGEGNKGGNQQRSNTK